MGQQQQQQQLVAGGVKQTAAKDDTKLISLDQKLITPDKRFRVHRQAAHKWLLTIDNVQPDDGNAYYLCQASVAEPRDACARRSPTGSAPVACVSRPRTNSQKADLGPTGSGNFKSGARLNVLGKFQSINCTLLLFMYT